MMFQKMLNVTLSLVKICNLLIKHLLSISFLSAKGNLMTANFISSNNYSGVRNFCFSLLNLKKSFLVFLFILEKNTKQCMYSLFLYEKVKC